jgi:hypothetical protein
MAGEGQIYRDQGIVEYGTNAVELGNKLLSFGRDSDGNLTRDPASRPSGQGPIRSIKSV